jgi:tripartite-type tricarboxylate transporter receptor subunit TctC
MKLNKFHWLVLGSLLIGVTAHAQAPFYQGKTVRVIVGTPPGNLYDLWARLTVEHMGKHLPGNPNFIVQNMPGAGHVVAVNYLYTQAKPDGLTIIGSVIPSLYLNQLLGRPEFQFEWSKFSWIGSPARGASQMYMRSDTPYKTIEDIRSAKEPPKCGASEGIGRPGARVGTNPVCDVARHGDGIVAPQGGASRLHAVYIKTRDTQHAD